MHFFSQWLQQKLGVVMVLLGAGRPTPEALRAAEIAVLRRVLRPWLGERTDEAVLRLLVMSDEFEQRVAAVATLPRSEAKNARISGDER